MKTLHRLDLHYCYRCGNQVHAEQASTKTVDSSGFNHYRHITCPSKESTMSTEQEFMGTAQFLHRRMATEAIIESGKEFYIIWNPTSQKPSTVAFETEEQAWGIADKMAAKSPDEKFFVLRSSGFAQTAQPVVRHKFANELSTTVEPKTKPAARKRS